MKSECKTDERKSGGKQKFVELFENMRWNSLNILKNRKKQWLISICVGLFAVALTMGTPMEKWAGFTRAESPQRLAWWGTLYPKFCFQETDGEDEKPEISFWLAKVLDWW